MSPAPGHACIRCGKTRWVYQGLVPGKPGLILRACKRCGQTWLAKKA